MSDASHEGVEIRAFEPRVFYGVRGRVKAESTEIGAFCGEVLPRMGRWIGERGLPFDGPPATIYHAHDEESGEFDLQPGFFVVGEAEEEGDVARVDTPGGEAAVLTHVGPYARLGESWGAIHEWFGKNGKTPGATCWETYLDDPGDTPPEKLRTEIVWFLG